MGFINGDTGKLILRVNEGEMAPKGLLLAGLWGDVEKASVRMTATEIVEDGGAV